MDSSLRRPLTVVALAAATLAVALVAWLVLRGTSIAAPASGLFVPATAGGEAQIAIQLQRIEQRLTALEASSGAAHAGIEARPPPMPPSIRQMQLERQQALADSNEAARKKRARYDSEFAVAPAPGRREIQASESLVQSMDSDSLLAETDPPLSHDVQCRANLCRLEFAFDSAAKADDWMMLYPVHAGKQLTRIDQYIDKAEDGSVRLIMYGQARR